jgi:hypothetical protein
MRLSRQRLRKIIREHLGTSPDTHRCMNGSTVPFGSDECVSDIELRIDDAAHSRDECSVRTDARQHYNGILNVLRRNLRSAKKENGVMYAIPEEL